MSCLRVLRQWKLSFLVLSGEIELDVFNSDIQSFPYSPLYIGDTPCPVSVSNLAANDNRLKQSCGAKVST